MVEHTRPEGAEEAPGTGVLSSAQESPSPRRGEKGGKNPDPCSSSAFHGFRVGSLRDRPGRFDRILSLGSMDAHCRRGMLGHLLAKAVVSADDMAHLVSVTDGYTGAQIEELANTLYILAVDGHNDTSGNGDGQPAAAIDRPLIEAALEEFRVELKARVGFCRG